MIFSDNLHIHRRDRFLSVRSTLQVKTTRAQSMPIAEKQLLVGQCVLKKLIFHFIQDVAGFRILILLAML